MFRKNGFSRTDFEEERLITIYNFRTSSFTVEVLEHIRSLPTQTIDWFVIAQCDEIYHARQPRNRRSIDERISEAGRRGSPWRDPLAAAVLWRSGDAVFEADSPR